MRSFFHQQEEEGELQSTSIDVCGDVSKNNRKHRGLYVCKKCGNVMNADVNGALNILKKVAPESVRIGVVAS